MSYVKISTNIIHSTVWRESHETVRVWLSLLAVSDRDGAVKISFPGLVDISRVTEAQCTTALDLFMSPDKHSRTEADEGRRIRKIPGGWLILNYALYREMDSAEERKEKDAARHKESYARKKREKELLEAALNENKALTPILCDSPKFTDSLLSDQAQAQTQLNSDQLTVPGVSAEDSPRQGSEQIQIQASPEAPPVPFGPKAFDMLFAAWPGPTSPQFQESEPKARDAWRANVTADNYPAFFRAWNMRVEQYQADRNPQRRAVLRSFREFCESGWRGVKPLESIPTFPTAPTDTSPIQFTD